MRVAWMVGFALIAAGCLESPREASPVADGGAASADANATTNVATTPSTATSTLPPSPSNATNHSASTGPTPAMPAGAMHGQDSEFGSIRTPYSADLVNGSRTNVQARVVLHQNYSEKDSRFFLFAWSVETTPLDVTFDRLIRADTSADIPCYQRQGDSRSQLKCFVDLKDLPPSGTDILMYGTVGSSRNGTYQVGAIVAVYTYSWTKVTMSNGLDAELYGYTIVNAS